MHSDLVMEEHRLPNRSLLGSSLTVQSCVLMFIKVGLFNEIFYHSGIYSDPVLLILNSCGFETPFCSLALQSSVCKHRSGAQ